MLGQAVINKSACRFGEKACIEVMKISVQVLLSISVVVLLSVHAAALGHF